MLDMIVGAREDNFIERADLLIKSLSTKVDGELEEMLSFFYVL